MKQVFDNVYCKGSIYEPRIFTFNKVLTNDEFNLIASGLINCRQNCIIYVKDYVLTDRNLVISCSTDIFNQIWNTLAFLNIIKYID